MELSNLDGVARPVEYELDWHTDQTYTPQPVSASAARWPMPPSPGRARPALGRRGRLWRGRRARLPLAMRAVGVALGVERTVTLDAALGGASREVGDVDGDAVPILRAQPISVTSESATGEVLVGMM